MKKLWYISLLITFLFFSIICYKNITNTKKEELQLEILTEKDTYENGEWISYFITIANNSKQSIYYKVSSCSMEIIGDNGFHAITDIDNILNGIYELKPDSKVKRDMTCYNGYLDFAHVMGIKTFPDSFRRKDTIDSVAILEGPNWSTWLSLPEGEYTFLIEFFYYEDKDCLNTPKKLTATKKINIISDGSSKIEKEIILEDRLRFYAISDKNIYRTGETLRTWAKIEPVEGKWYPWYEQAKGPEASQALVSIALINCDTKEELDIYNRVDLIPNEYKEPYFILQNNTTSKGVSTNSWLKKEGNYIIQYQLKYLTYETQELKLVTIDLPITVIPNEPNQTFRYSNPGFSGPAFEEYNEPVS